jgi:hypothetical protein
MATRTETVNGWVHEISGFYEELQSISIPVTDSLKINVVFANLSHYERQKLGNGISKCAIMRIEKTRAYECESDDYFPFDNKDFGICIGEKFGGFGTPTEAQLALFKELALTEAKKQFVNMQKQCLQFNNFLNNL